jgi:hypothetical protein
MLWTANVLAGPVTLQQAQQTAYDFIKQHFASGKALRRTTASLPTEQLTKSEAYYAFNIGNDEGFVLVSGDDCLGPIVMYSDKGTFNTANMPDNMRSFLQSVEASVRYVQQTGGAPSSATPRRAAGWENVEPIVKAHWNQSTPYNGFCPMLRYNKRDQRAVTGCVATAMAQIMMVYQFPDTISADIPAYDFQFQSKTYTQDGFAKGTAIEWEDIQFEYPERHDEPDSADIAVAHLMALCGASVEMSYGIGELGGSQAISANAADALVKYFGYKPNTVRNINRYDYSWTQWSELIYKELLAGRPVLYYGQSQQNGHAFICDGYENRYGADFFHINWGWGGLSDTYVDLRVCLPELQGAGGGSYGYAMSQGAVVGIQPASEGDQPLGDLITVDHIDTYTPSNIYTRLTPNDDFKAMPVIYQAVNYNSTGHHYDLGLRVVDLDGKVILDIPDTKLQNADLQPNYGWKVTKESDAVPVTITSAVPFGTYRIVATHRITGTTEWIQDLMSDARYIEFTIDDQLLTITKVYKEPKVDLAIEGDITITGDNVSTHEHHAIFTLKNNGTDFRNDLYYTINESWPKVFYVGTFAEVNEGGEYKCDITFIPDRKGENILKIYYGNEQKVLLGTATIDAQGSPHLTHTTIGAEDFDAEIEAVTNTTTLTITESMTNDGTADLTSSNTSFRVFLCYSDSLDAPYTKGNYEYMLIETIEDWGLYIYKITQEEYTDWTINNLKIGESVSKAFTHLDLDKRPYKKATETPYTQRLFFHLIMEYDVNTRVILNSFFGNTYRIAETAGISDLTIETPKATGAVYNLQGKKVANRLQSLPKGIYIQNGRKFVVK